MAKYIMVGGFLGAGKTTTLIRFAEKLRRDGLKVGLITNDQAADLVDTALVKAGNFPVEEIAGGCFCCRFNSLKEAADNLEKSDRPDVFLAEPVGSCTDLVATVSYPLRRIYGDNFAISPLTVLLDPARAMRIFELAEGRNFSEKVRYIYLKQIEESEALVVNKIDSLTAIEREKLTNYLKKNYPDKTHFFISSRTGEGFDNWAEWILQAEMGDGRCMAIDYDIYAEGEAELGWLNATLDFQVNSSIDGNQFLQKLANQLAKKFSASGKEVAHLKMTLSPEDGSGELASINQVGSSVVPELGNILLDEISVGQLIVNIRAEAEPEIIKRILEEVILNFPELTLEHVEHFKPGRPVPTYRFLGASG